MDCNNPSTNVIGTHESASSEQPSVNAERAAHSRMRLSGNHLLHAITGQSSDKEKRLAVKAIAADYEKLQLAGMDGTDNGSIAASRDRRIAALTSIQTKIAQLVATGLSEQPPAFSISRTGKNTLALAGGVATKAGQVVAAGVAVAGAGAVGAAILPVNVFYAGAPLLLAPCMCEVPCNGEGFYDPFFYPFTMPFYSTYKMLRSDRLANALSWIDAYPSAVAYATRPRLPTSFIAAQTATQIEAELSRVYRATLTVDERADVGAQTSTTGSSGTGQHESWHFSETKYNAVAFNAFQALLTTTAEYRNKRSSPEMIRRVDTLVDAMRVSPSLRETCFAIASVAIESCGDRVALGLNDMEYALISENAESGKLSTGELFYTGVACFKKKILDEIASAKIDDFKRRGIEVDEIEIRLAFPTELRDRLRLPGVTQSMHYRASARVTAREIASAEKTVGQKLKNGNGIEFLSQWQPWCKAMERANPGAFSALRDETQIERNAISVMPTHMTEQMWLDALAAQKTHEEVKFTGLVKQITKQFIAHHGFEMT